MIERHRRVPAPIVPRPAVSVPDLRGRRVIIGLPGAGWRHDLRSDAPVQQNGRSYIPVLPEHEWYRAETEQIEVFAPLVAVERVWVEEHGPEPSRPVPDLAARIVTLDAPPRRDALPARDVAGLTGRRVIEVPAGDAGEGDGGGPVGAVERRDIRAVTEPYPGTQGDIWVRVAAEADWYRWGWSGRFPHTLAVPLRRLWVE